MKQVLPTNKNGTRFLWLVAVLIIGVSISHYLTPITHPHFHEIFRRLYFLPIILAAVRLGFIGGLITALSVCFIYLPHVIFQWSGSFEDNLVRFNEIVLFLLIGSIAGFLSDKTKKERDLYQKTAEKLDSAYKKLKLQSDEMTELEHQLRSADRLAVLGELAASLAHEVRNPLGSIKGASQIIRKRCTSDEIIQEFTQVLIDEVDRLNRVIDNYLSVAKQSAGHDEKSDLIAVIESVLQLTGPNIRKQQIQIETQWPNSRVMVPINETELRQVFLNLMLNSIAALNPSDGKITIAVIQNGGTKITFSDNGKGIEAKNLDKIFTPFYSTKKDGTGLGLAIVKRIVESHRGTVNAISQPGTGFTLEIIFPKVEEPSI